MYRYKLHYEDGSEAGEAVYAMPIGPGDEIIAAGTQKVRVLDLVLTEDDSDKYVGLPTVEPAGRMRDSFRDER